MTIQAVEIPKPAARVNTPMNSNKVFTTYIGNTVFTRWTHRSWLLSKAVRSKLNIGPIKRIDRKTAGEFLSIPLFIAHKLG